MSSEAGTVLGSHGMRQESAMRNMSQLNVFWDGMPVRIDRRTSENFVVEDARLTIGLAVQPETIRAFYEATKGLARNVGFAARFLIAWPDSTQGKRPFREVGSFPAVDAFGEQMTELLALQTKLDDRGRLTRAMLELSTEAKQVWIAFHNEVESQLKGGGEMACIRDVASKAADNTARLAALFHVYERGRTGEIGATHMAMAAVVVAWHLKEARRFLGEVALPRSVNNAAKLDDWLLRRCSERGVAHLGTREIQQYGPGAVRDRAAFDAAIKELADADRVREIKLGRQRLVLVNPALLRSEQAA